MADLYPLSVRVSSASAHLAGFRNPDSIAAEPCALVAELGASMSPGRQRHDNLESLSREFLALATTHLLCDVCGRYLIAARAAEDAAAFKAITDKIQASTQPIARDALADLYTFGEGELRQAAANAMSSLIRDFDSTDGDSYIALSRAAYGNADARDRYWNHIEAMKQLMLDTLREAGYDI